MPIAIIHIIEGRDASKKRKLIATVTSAIATSLDVPVDTVRVLVQECPPELWGAGNETLAERRDGAMAPASLGNP